MRPINALLFAFAWLIGASAVADDQSKRAFAADPAVQRAASAYAAQAVAMARTQFGIQLDWTDASIARLETVLVKVHASYTAKSPRPGEEQIMAVAKVYGSYMGEVYRRNHGAEWGMVTLDGQRFPGMRTSSGTNFWPWGRVSQRISKGGDNNVADYYHVLLTK